MTPDELFHYIITINNPNECVVEGLKPVEAPTLRAGVLLVGVAIRLDRSKRLPRRSKNDFG